MASPRLWRKLAEGFQSIRGQDSLQLVWSKSMTDGKIIFQVNGTVGDKLQRAQFNNFSAKAGRAAYAKHPDVLIAWFEMLQQKAGSVDKGFVSGRFTGTIQNPAEASAVLCMEFETTAIRNLSQRINANPAKVFSHEETEDEAAQGNPDDPVVTERLKLLADFKQRGRRQGINKITDEMITQAANPGKWNGRTQIGWWKRNNAGCNRPCDGKIRRLLAKQPAEIWPDKVRR